MIEDTGDDGVDDLFDGGRARVKGRIGWNERCASQQEQLEVLYVDEADRGFARDKDQFFALLEHDIRGAEKHIFAIAMGNPSKRAHAAWDDDHGIASV